jgi:hypothetical protein
MTDVEIVGACSMHGEMRNVHNILVKKPRRKSQLGIQRRRHNNKRVGRRYEKVTWI